MDKVHRFQLLIVLPANPFSFRFCQEELPEDENDIHDPVMEAERIDRELDVATVRAFQGWLLETGKFKQLDAVLSYCRHWRMAFRSHTGRRVDDRIAKDMKAVSVPPVLVLVDRELIIYAVHSQPSQG